MVIFNKNIYTAENNPPLESENGRYEPPRGTKVSELSSKQPQSLPEIRYRAWSERRSRR